MRILLLLAAFAVGFCTAERTEFYRGHKILSVRPQDAKQAKTVWSISELQGADLLSHHVVANREAALMLPPASLDLAQRTLREANITFSIVNHDVQESVDREASLQNKSRSIDIATGPFWLVPTFERYMRYDEIVSYLDLMATAYPDLVTVESIGKSFEGRDMWVIKISKSKGKASRAVFVDAGIHAREWIAPPVAIYLIQQLLEQQTANADLLQDLDWYIVPLINPDGYEWTHTHERMWRKNRSDKSSKSCKGIDLNRNFGFHWHQSGVSDDPCSQTFAGPKEFSEVESQHLRDYILKENENKRIKMYLTLHSYGPLILYPFGYDYGLAPAKDEAELISIGNEANDAMVKAGSERFTVENSADLYPAAGASDDWSKGVAGIEKSYTIELPGGGYQGFDMPPDQIKHIVTTVFPGLRVFALRAKKL